MKLTKPIKVTSFKEAQEKCPKGYRLLHLWELVKLAEEKHPVIFETEKGKWIWFLSGFVEDEIVRWLARRRGGWDAGWLGRLGDFDEGCRVVYVKKGSGKK